MAKSFDEVIDESKRLEAGGKDAKVAVSVSTLQTGGVSMYAIGQLDYQPGGAVGLMYRWPSLASSGYNLTCYFSNRRGSNTPPLPGRISGNEQPFYAKSTSKMRLSIGLNSLRGLQTRFLMPPYATIRFEGSQSYSVQLQREGDLLIGLGPALEGGSGADHAIYAFEFREFVPLPPPH